MKGNENRSISVGGNASSNTMIIGDDNKVSVHHQQKLEPGNLDVLVEQIEAIRDLLDSFPFPEEEQMKLDNALADAEMESKEPVPDPDEIGDAMSRALQVATKAEAFAEKTSSLLPKITKMAILLGTGGQKILRAMGL
jgi:hypothetical protein